jgi:hypothetical protein
MKNYVLDVQVDGKFGTLAVDGKQIAVGRPVDLARAIRAFLENEIEKAEAEK